MKRNKVLATTGITSTDSIRLRSYCSLMQSSLIDKWLFAEDSEDFHVCIISSEYFNKMNKDTGIKPKIFIIVNQSYNQNLNHKYQVSLPFTATKIKDILNQISKDEKFESLNIKKPKNTDNKIKSLFSKFRKSFRSYKNLNKRQAQQKRKTQFITKLTQKINPEHMPSLRIVLLGSPGSGKTTAINSASKGKALSTDVTATDSVASVKDKTTIGIDYSDIQLTSLSETQGGRIKLYGTPGQIKFNFIWDMVGKSADAVVILLDMSRSNPISYLNFYMKYIQNQLANETLIYCVLTHTDKYTGNTLEYFNHIKDEFPKLKGIYEIDVRIHDDIMMFLNKAYIHIQNNNDILHRKEYMGQAPQ